MSKKLSLKAVHDFQKTIFDYYTHHGRHHLPWRHTYDPYHILVSEIMLQQTQVDRVLPKYLQFLERFPTATDLAQAPLKDVLTMWVGLGYNRRAKYLKLAAEQVTMQGGFPTTIAGLRLLPGVGPYTAAAVAAFSYQVPVVMIETNIRTVFIHHFYTHETESVSDQELLGLISQTVPNDRVREWYYALMDYGSYLKKTVGNHKYKSTVYTTQKAFRGSARQVRGYIIRSLTEAPGAQSVKQLAAVLPKEVTYTMLTQQLTALTADGLIVLEDSSYRIAT